MSRTFSIAAGILAVAAVVAVDPARLPAQDVIRLEGRPLSITPVFEPEDRPQVRVGEPPAAMLTAGGDTVVTCVAYSPDGKTLAVGDGPNRPICTFLGLPPINPNGGLIRLIDTATNRVRATLTPEKRAGHEYEVDRLWFSPDGKRLISLETDAIREEAGIRRTERFVVRDLARGGPGRVVAEREWSWHPYDVATDRLSMALIDRDGTARIRDVATGRERLSFRVSDDPGRAAYRVEFSPDGRILAVGLDDGAVILQDAGSGRRLASFAHRPREGFGFRIAAMAFAPDGRRLAVLGSFRVEDRKTPIPTPAARTPPATSEVRFFDVDARREEPGPRVRDGEEFHGLIFATDGKSLIAVGAYLTRVWDAATGEDRASSRRDAYSVCDLAISPDGKVLAVGEDSFIRLSDAATGRERVVLGPAFGPPARQFAFARDGKMLASTGTVLDLWDMRAALEPRPDEGHTDEVTSLAWSPDGKSLATGSVDRTVKVWDLATRKPRATLRGHEDAVASVAYAPDGRALVSGGWDATVRLWDPATATERARLAGHSGPVNAVAVSPDGRTIASGSGGYGDAGEVKLWDLAGGRLVATAMEKVPPVHAVAFAPDGSTLAIGRDDGMVALWDLAARRARTLPCNDPGDRDLRGVLCLAYAPDGRRLAAGRKDQTIRTWELLPDKEVPSIAMTHEEYVVAVAFSPDGKTLAACDRDGAVILRDAATGRELGRLASAADPWFTSLSFAPDGRHLAAGNRDRSISIYPIERTSRPGR